MLSAAAEELAEPAREIQLARAQQALGPRDHEHDQQKAVFQLLQNT